MTHPQYLANITLTTAGTLTRFGAKILGATANNDRPWVKARMPDSLTAQARLQLLIISWQCPAIVEWKHP